MKGIVIKKKICGSTTGGRYHISRDKCFESGTVLHIVSKREKGRLLVVESEYGGGRTIIPSDKSKYEEVTVESVFSRGFLVKEQQKKRSKKK